MEKSIMQPEDWLIARKVWQVIPKSYFSDFYTSAIEDIIYDSDCLDPSPDVFSAIAKTPQLATRN